MNMHHDFHHPPLPQSGHDLFQKRRELCKFLMLTPDDKLSSLTSNMISKRKNVHVFLGMARTAFAAGVASPHQGEKMCKLSFGCKVAIHHSCSSTAPPLLLFLCNI